MSTAHTDSSGSFDAEFVVGSTYAGRGPTDLTVIAAGETSAGQDSETFGLTLH